MEMGNFIRSHFTRSSMRLAPPPSDSLFVLNVTVLPLCLDASSKNIQYSPQLSHLPWVYKSEPTVLTVYCVRLAFLLVLRSHIIRRESRRANILLLDGTLVRFRFSHRKFFRALLIKGPCLHVTNATQSAGIDTLLITHKKSHLKSNLLAFSGAPTH